MHYESHQGKLLKEHLLEVAEGARSRLDHPALRHRKLLRDAAYLMGLVHDLGKYTPYFQAYLKEQKRFEEGLEHHSFFGAVCGAYLLHARLQKLPEAPGKEFLPLLGYLVIYRHHGDLVAPAAALPPLGNPEKATGELCHSIRAFKKQLQELKKTPGWASEWEELGLAEILEFLKNPRLSELFEELDGLTYKLKRQEEEEGARFCLWGQLLFSALIDADKFGAAAITLPERHYIPADLVERFLQQQRPKPRHEMDCLRQEFQQAVRKSVESLKSTELPGRTLALTAPTGLGKTLAALDAALRLREKLRELWGNSYAPRIIYALPFINVIEQNYHEFHRVFSFWTENNNVPETLLLRHHYLTEITYREPAAHPDNLPLEQALLLTEAWESEVVITTFVQVFQTLLGHRNRFLKKLHNLIGSILILDEVQSIPMEYWPVTAKTFETLQRELGLTVLQMTATRPLIFPQVQELYPNPAALFRHQRRTRLIIHRKEVPLDTWAEQALRLYEEHGSLLCVLNTVRASLEIYKLLRDKLQGVESYDLKPPNRRNWLVYLSTNIVPWQRRTRINAIKQHLRKGGRVLVVSTQVVEAGVDLDFPATLRDLGPVDSVIQVAGRCNREGQRQMGDVYVLPLEGGGCARVYGAIHTYVAKRVLLEGPSKREEPEYAKLVEQYFQEARKRLSSERSDELWRAYIRLAYDCLEEPTLSEFHLIESPEQVPIFVALSPKREQLIEAFKRDVLKESDVRKRRMAYLRYRRRLHDFMVRPLLYRAISNLPPALDSARPRGIRWVPYEQLRNFYSEETGFRWAPHELDQPWIE
ncbi:MAG: CRISPR-associated helicase Cas3' [Thermoproteota archaeon]